MEYKAQADHDDDDGGEIEIPSSTSLSFNHPIRGSAFSKPILSPSSSLISPRGGGGGDGTGSPAAMNVNLFGSSTPSSSSLHPTTSAADVDGSYQSASRSSDPAQISGAITAGNSKAAAARNSTSAASTTVPIRYRECLRNHAVAIGGHVLDGCGEFMPEGDSSAPEALKCAACGCHRSFHRKEADGDAEAAADSYYHGAVRLSLLLPPPPHPQAQQHHHHHHKQLQLGSPTIPSASGVVAFGGNASGSGGTTTESSSEERININAGAPTPATAPRKRSRTKFTAEQKEKMLAFSERVGWRIQKQDEALVERFCGEVGVRRQVLKVWMHNNKHLIRKPQQAELLPQQQQQQQQL